MKKITLLLFVVGFCFAITPTKAQTASSGMKNITKKAYSPIDGAWQSADHKEFSILMDGFFSSIAEDSTGMWKNTHAGTYTVDNANTLTLKVLYSSWPEHVGALHTVEYDLQGETLTLKWFKKLIDAKQGDITAQLPQGTQTQYVRVKK